MVTSLHGLMPSSLQGFGCESSCSHAPKFISTWLLVFRLAHHQIQSARAVKGQNLETLKWKRVK